MPAVLLSQAMRITFRKTPKQARPGRTVIAGWRHEIEAADAIVADHHNRWRAGRPTPAAALFDELSPLWAQLPDGGEIEVEWSSGRIVGST